MSRENTAEVTDPSLLQELIQILPAYLIERQPIKADCLKKGLAKFDELVEKLTEHDKQAARAILTHRLADTLFEMHMAVLGLLNSERARKISTELDRRVALQAVHRDFREADSIYFPEA